MLIRLILVAMLLFASPIIAAPPPAERAKSVDDQLLEDEPGTAGAEKKPADQTSNEKSPDDLVSKLAAEMRATQRLLSERRSDALTQRKQQAIADALAALLKHAGQSQKSSSNSASAQPKTGQSKPGGNTASTGAASDNPNAKESVERHGPAKTARPDPADLGSAIKDRWGHLPANVYEEVVQAARGRFLTQYELEIEKYFQRLLEQRDGQKK
jgi:hypothetical protein